jgi:hypothetical protein
MAGALIIFSGTKMFSLLATVCAVHLSACGHAQAGSDRGGVGGGGKAGSSKRERVFGIT